MSGEGSRFRADPAGLSRRVELEGLTILYHRPSGMTHVLAPPAPQILELLAEAEASLPELKSRMAAAYELEGGDDALASRLEELVAAGLVERS